MDTEKKMVKKVFIISSPYDLEFITSTEKYLKDIGIESTYEEKFLPGELLIDNVLKEIRSCDKVIVVLSQKSYEEGWIRYQTLLALEKSQRSKHINLILILYCITAPDIGKRFFGVPSEDVIVTVDKRKDCWETCFKKKLEAKLNEEITVRHVLRKANVCTGQAWSHFTGYCQNVYPELKKELLENEYYRNNSDSFPLVEFNFIPDLARSVKTLEELDPRIKLVKEKALKIKHGRGSYSDRQYDVAIYSIKETINGEEKTYFFIGQIPNTMCLLSKLKDGRSQGSSGWTELDMSAGERSLQVSRFYFTLNRLVNHPENKACNHMVCLIPYDDSDPNINVGNILLEKIKRHLHVNTRDNAIEHSSESCCPSERAHYKSVCLDFKDQDVDLYNVVKQYLDEKGFKTHGRMPGKPELDLEQVMKECKWFVCILSKKSIEKTGVLRFNFRQVLHKSIKDNQLRVIAILDGLVEAEIPYELQAVNYIDKNTEGYLKNLVDTLNCQSITMDSLITATDVHEGLAWCYVLNYLEPTWKGNENKSGHGESLAILKKEYSAKRVYDKLVVVVTQSCCSDFSKMKQPVTEKFHKLDDVKFKEEHVNGVPRRYQIVPYIVKKGDQEHIVAMEISNAVLCMKEMANMSKVSGLSSFELQVEVKNFFELTQAIVDEHPVLKDKIKLVYCEGETLEAEATDFYEKVCELLHEDDGTPV